MKRRDEGILAAAVGILLTALCYGHAVYAPLLWDDMDVVTPAGVRLTVGDIPSFFSPAHWLSVDPSRPRPYRPVRESFLAIVGDVATLWQRTFGTPGPGAPGHLDLRDPALADRVAWGYHLGNLVLHAVNCFLVFLLARRLVPGRAGAFAALVIFAVHPVHVEALVWVKNAAELLGLALILAAMLAFMRAAEGRPAPGRWVLSILLYLLAVLSKEAALPLPALLALWAVIWLGGRARRRALLMTLPLWAAGLMFSAFQHGFVTATASAGGAGGGPVFRLMVCAQTLMRYGVMVLLPIRYVPLHDRLPAVGLNAWRAALVLAGFAALGGLLVVQAWRRRRLAFGLWWVLLALAPVSNLVAFNSARPVAEQRLYVPSVGLALFAGAFVQGLFPFPTRRRGKLPLKQLSGLAAVAVAALACVVLVRHAGPTWRAKLDFWRWASRTTPSRFMPFYNGGIMYAKAAARAREAHAPGTAEAAERLAEAAYLHALWNHPNWGHVSAANACRNMGNSLRRRGETAAAVRFYRLGLAAHPADAAMRRALGRSYIDLARKDRAVIEFLTARRLEPERAQPSYAILAQLYHDLGRNEEALPEVKRALEVQPNRAVLWRLAGDIYDALGRPDEAARCWQRAEALRRSPPRPGG